MTVVVSARLDDELGGWLAEYAAARGVTRQALVETALAGFMEDCKSGVPEIRERARRQSVVRDDAQGVGECRKGKAGHVWETVDGQRRCKFCAMPGRAFLAEFGADRAAFFQNLKPPMVSGAGKAPGGGAK